MSWVEVFRDGGPFVYVVLLTFLAVPVAVVARAAAAAMGWRVPQALWLSIGVVPLAVGLLGAACRCHSEMSTFTEAGIEHPEVEAARE